MFQEWITHWWSKRVRVSNRERVFTGTRTGLTLV